MRVTADRRPCESVYVICAETAWPFRCAACKEATVKDRPIIFSAESVLAILDGRKTQTRRIVKLTAAGRVKEPGSSRNWHLGDPLAVYACPYGRPGDRLWVRETWCPEYESEGSYLYRATISTPVIFPDGGHWRSPIHMPRRAARLTLEITDVRVQRLQEISEEDAMAEGVPSDLAAVCYVGEGQVRPDKLSPGSTWRVTPHQHLDAADHFACAWESINGKRAPWESNPFVWVVGFKRADREDVCS